jgi:hypothetical protein
MDHASGFFVMDEQRCASELVNALAGAIMAESTEHWGSRHPAEWALWYQLAMQDPDVVRLERAAWLDVADRLEEALNEP